MARLVILGWLQTAVLLSPEVDGDDLAMGDLLIITGRGRHSDHGEAVLRPSVLAFLRDELGLEARVNPQNVGQVIVPRGGLQCLWPPAHTLGKQVGAAPNKMIEVPADSGRKCTWPTMSHLYHNVCIA